MNVFYYVYDASIDEVIHISVYAENAYESFYSMRYRALTHIIKIYKCFISSFFDDELNYHDFIFDKQLLDTYVPSEDK